MNEAAYWSRVVRPALAPFGKLTRIENLIEIGTPDVAYCLRQTPLSTAHAGWLELKVLSALPARRSTPVRIDHLTVDQVRWGESWAAAGGRCWLLLGAGDRHILLAPPWPRRIYQGQATVPELVQGAAVWGIGRFPAGKILKALAPATGTVPPQGAWCE